MRDGRAFQLTAQELVEAGEAAEYRWLAGELEYRLNHADDYGLEGAARLLRDGLLDPGALLDSCWGRYWDEGRSEGVGRCIASGARTAVEDAAYGLWSEFGDVPCDPESECLEAGWRGFPAGTFREDVWRWFEERFRVSVARDLMRAV